MSKWIPNLLLISVLLIVALACVAPSATIPDPNIINTAIAQTYSAALIQTAQFGIPITGQESLTPTMTKFPHRHLSQRLPLSCSEFHSSVFLWTQIAAQGRVRATTEWVYCGRERWLRWLVAAQMGITGLFVIRIVWVKLVGSREKMPP
jgi:hypothetical protein